MRTIKAEIPNYAPHDQIRLDNQERGDIRNHFLADRASFAENQPLVIITHVSGKSWFLKEEEIKHMNIRIDLEIKIFLAKTYHIEIEAIKYTVTMPGLAGDDDSVLETNDFSLITEKSKVENKVFTSSVDTFIDLCVEIGDMGYEIFHALNGSTGSENSPIHTDYEREKPFTYEDVSFKEEEEPEIRAKKMQLKKNLINAYNNVFLRYKNAYIEQNRKLKEAEQAMADSSAEKNKALNEDIYKSKGIDGDVKTQFAGSKIDKKDSEEVAEEKPEKTDK